jgi:hypothetical protein
MRPKETSSIPGKRPATAVVLQKPPHPGFCQFFYTQLFVCQAFQSPGTISHA